MNVELGEHQITAIHKMKNGCVLAGGTGTGKSRTAIYYYYHKVCGGDVKVNGKGSMKSMKQKRDLYIITTAKKRDSLEWEMELSHFALIAGFNESHHVNIVIDSWNNIKKYQKVIGAFFIFDEQRVIGYGAWTKAFLNIARKNQWILLSATPGDTWSDYIPVFIANGFYKNKSEFNSKHVVFSRFTKYPRIERYVNEGILLRHRYDILVPMEIVRITVPYKINFYCDYDKTLYKTVWKDRWDPYDNQPIEETGKLFYLLRKVVNSDDSRGERVREIFTSHRRAIVFYNYSYERDILRELFDEDGIDIGEWNGQVHSDVPDSEDWAYLVQYSAGCEGWNCITTNCMIFYSQSYSYRMTHQAEGRIDRLNTPYKDLYYYYLKSRSPIDLAISAALANKKNFNERSFIGS